MIPTFVRPQGAGSALVSALKRQGAKVYLPENDPVDAVWSTQPAPLAHTVHEHPLRFSGKRATDKISDLAKWLGKYARTHAEDANASEHVKSGVTYLVTALDEVAWILNLRGDQFVPNTPVFPAYVAVTLSSGREGYETQPTVRLFVDSAFVPRHSKVAQYLADMGVQVYRYEDVWAFLAGPCPAASPETAPSHLLVSGEKASLAVVSTWKGGSGRRAAIVGADNPVALAKSIKNATEIQGFKNAYLRDGIAWTLWAARLEEDIIKGRIINEWDAALRLDNERQKMAHYAGLSYAPYVFGFSSAVQPRPVLARIPFSCFFFIIFLNLLASTRLYDPWGHAPVQ